MSVKRIVVGTDGSDNSFAALRWAIDEALVRDAAVEVVYSWEFPPIIDPLGVSILPSADEMSRGACAWTTCSIGKSSTTSANANGGLNAQTTQQSAKAAMNASSVIEASSGPHKIRGNDRGCAQKRPTSARLRRPGALTAPRRRRGPRRSGSESPGRRASPCSG